MEKSVERIFWITIAFGIGNAGISLFLLLFVFAVLFSSSLLFLISMIPLGLVVGISFFLYKTKIKIRKVVVKKIVVEKKEEKVVEVEEKKEEDLFRKVEEDLED